MLEKLIKMIQALIEALNANTVAQRAYDVATEGETSEKPPSKKVVSKKKGPAKKKSKSGTTKQQVTDLLLSVANDIDRDTAVGILNDYKVEKVSELDPDDYNAIAKALQKALDQHESEKEAAAGEEETDDDDDDIFGEGED